MGVDSMCLEFYMFMCELDVQVHFFRVLKQIRCWNFIDWRIKFCCSIDLQVLMIVLSGRLILVHQYGTITPPSLLEQEVLLCSFLMHQHPILILCIYYLSIKGCKNGTLLFCHTRICCIQCCESDLFVFVKWFEIPHFDWE